MEFMHPGMVIEALVAAIEYRMSLMSLILPPEWDHEISLGCRMLFYWINCFIGWVYD